MTFADIAAFFDVGLNRANQFYAWGWRASLVGALITAFGVGFLYWGTRVRDRDFESQMVKFNLEASQARERAGSLEKRSAELEKETAQARLEQERLKHIVKWRILSPESLSRLAAGLQAGGTATLAYGPTIQKPFIFGLKFLRHFLNPHGPFEAKPAPTRASSMPGFSSSAPTRQIRKSLRTHSEPLV